MDTIPETTCRNKSQRLIEPPHEQRRVPEAAEFAPHFGIGADQPEAEGFVQAHRGLVGQGHAGEGLINVLARQRARSASAETHGCVHDRSPCRTSIRCPLPGLT